MADGEEHRSIVDVGDEERIRFGIGISLEEI
jgi:hypothetical protein